MVSFNIFLSRVLSCRFASRIVLNSSNDAFYGLFDMDVDMDVDIDMDIDMDLGIALSL
jgi:hypothetical protein